MSLLQTLLTPGYDEHPDRAFAARAANLIQVGEFQFLQLAHSEWFGRDLSEAEGNRVFHSYMVQNRVPPWVRHYARRIIALDAAGELDDQDPAYHRYDPDSQRPVNVGVWRMSFACAVVAICVIGGLWVSTAGAGKATSFLPPYFTEEELEPRH